MSQDEPTGREDLAAQLLELQSQVAFQEDAISALDSALASQQQEILLMQRQVELLKQRQDEQAAGHASDEAAATAIEKPPHY